MLDCLEQWHGGDILIKLILNTRAERCEKPHMPSQFGRAHDDDELPGGGGGG